jgi:Anti-sigma-K factor rskA
VNGDESQIEPRQPLVDELTEGPVSPPEAAAWERAAAAAHAGLILERPIEALPAGLEAKLRRGVADFAKDDGRVVRPSFRRSALAWSGWLAAAASLALAASLWLDSGRRSGASTGPDLAARLERVEAAPDVIRVPFSAGSAEEGQAGGEVVWSTGRQEGFLRLRGVRVNDPRMAQYQLWIVDPLRDAKFPVDGGVFDVAGGDVVVPIEAKLRILSPTAFVVTREQSGGVVKSQAAQPVLLATVK